MLKRRYQLGASRSDDLTAPCVTVQRKVQPTEASHRVREHGTPPRIHADPRFSELAGPTSRVYAGAYSRGRDPEKLATAASPVLPLSVHDTLFHILCGPVEVAVAFPNMFLDHGHGATGPSVQLAELLAGLAPLLERVLVIFRGWPVGGIELEEQARRQIRVDHAPLHDADRIP